MRRLLHNVSSLLKPGGYFFGITPDSSTIWYVTVIANTSVYLAGFHCVGPIVSAVYYFRCFVVLIGLELYFVVENFILMD